MSDKKPENNKGTPEKSLFNILIENFQSLRRLKPSDPAEVNKKPQQPNDKST